MTTKMGGQASPRPYGSLQNIATIANQPNPQQNQQDSLAPRSGSELSVRPTASGASATQLSPPYKRLRSIAVEWAQSVLGGLGIVVKTEDDGAFINELRTGVLPCQLVNALAPGTARISDVKSTFSTLENLASFTAALILYGMERKAVLRPLDFVNGTLKGDEMMIKNLVQLSILAHEKGFKTLSYSPLQAREALEALTLPPLVTPTSVDQLSSTASLDSSDAIGKLVQRIEVLDAGMSRLIKTLTEKVEKSEKGSNRVQATMEKVFDTLDLVFRKLVDIDVAQKDIQERMRGFSNSVNRRSRPISMTESEMDDGDYDGTGSVRGKPRLHINPEGPKRGQSSDSLLNSGMPDESLRRAVSTSEKVPRGDLSASLNISATSSSPSLLGTAPTTPISPKLFSKLPMEVMNAGLPKVDMMRLSVVYELIETESDYVKDLGIMVNYHKPEVRATKLVSDQDVTVLFSNIEQLIAANTQLLTRLNARKESNPVIEEVGDILVEVSDSLKVYTVYCGNYPQAMKLVHQLQSRPDFKEYIQKWMNSPEGRGLSLESFLIKPVQRICKYPLLLRELLRYCDKSHKDFANLTLAAEKIEAVVALVNEATQALDRKEKLISLQTRIESQTPLSLQDKKLLKDGLIQKISGGKSKERFLVLCADVLITCKVPAKFKYQLESITNTGDIYLKTDFKGDLSTRSLKYFFQIQTSSEKFTISCASEDEKNKWMESFNTAIKQAEQEGRRASAMDFTTKRISDSFDSSNLKGKGSIKKTVTGISGNMFSKQPKKGPTARRRGISAETFESQSTLETETEEDNGFMEPEMVDIQGAIWKRAISATGHSYYFNPATKETTWRIPETAIILDPATGRPYQDEAEGLEEEAELEYEPEVLEGHPDWRYVDRGDGNPYYFNAVTMEVSWYPPGYDQLASNAA
ncbi:Myosin 10A, isoform D [Phlyctochytrium planicorne]|nr:Myosin 10A, isoform D [Phlyctochytrium planicorne]